ncbi:aminoglycoside phosphotransferase family protein [Leifsonia sp. NPDC058230]|uniref:aminoglycoside phosphotransferase family protein n=1 Tax=Leifsonia sp. NPDC058230 TaxID=3346391 RepID=UPI0036D9522A
MAMHDDQLHIDERMASQLIHEQFPHWRLQGVRELATDGTVNAIFRIGDDLTARFPLRAADPEEVGAELIREGAAMRELAACCPFPTPARVAVGAPGHGYPLPWAVQTWLPGSVATPAGLARSRVFARDLTALVQSLRAADTAGRTFDGTGRGGVLRDADRWMEVCFRESATLLPVERLRELWRGFRELPNPYADVMTHGDLIPGNLLVDGERLVGVLDGGGFAAADRAVDLVAVWNMLDSDNRVFVRSELGCSELEWQRGAAWAFVQAMGLVWYYRESNPGMSALGRSALTRILDDSSLS